MKENEEQKAKISELKRKVKKNTKSDSQGIITNRLRTMYKKSF